MSIISIPYYLHPTQPLGRPPHHAPHPHRAARSLGRCVGREPRCQSLRGVHEIPGIQRGGLAAGVAGVGAGIRTRDPPGHGEGGGGGRPPEVRGVGGWQGGVEVAVASTSLPHHQSCHVHSRLPSPLRVSLAEHLRQAWGSTIGDLGQTRQGHQASGLRNAEDCRICRCTVHRNNSTVATHSPPHTLTQRPLPDPHPPHSPTHTHTPSPPLAAPSPRSQGHTRYIEYRNDH